MDRYRIPICIYFALIFVLLSILLVLIIVCSMEDLPPTNTNGKLCLQAGQDGFLKCQSSNIALADFLDTTLATEYQHTKQTEHDKIDAYFSEHQNDSSIHDMYNNDYWEQKPTARLSGKTSKEPLIDSKSMETITDWTSQDAYSFLMRGIRYNKGRLVVPVSGIYFMYSFVDLFEPCIISEGKPDIEDLKSPIKHGIYKYNILDGKEQPVIVSHQPHKWSLNRYHNSYSSYVSTIAELMAGDEIYVKVSNITYIQYADYNYFGINMI